MRRRAPDSEIFRFAAPLARAIDAAWRRMHWWLAAMGILYVFSGIVIVRSGEIVVIKRWGEVVGTHGPGLMFAFPRPIDDIVRVDVKHIWELRITTLVDANQGAYLETIDPLTQGYALTGDQNVVHVEVVARYYVRDPVEWAFYGPRTEEALRVEVSAAMVRSLGEMGVDRVLSDGRKALATTAMRRAQAGLDAAHAGIELTSLELTRLAPPRAVAADFEAVQSAFIGAETERKQAQELAQRVIPKAQADADQLVQTAHADAASALARAEGDAEIFLDLHEEYRANRAVVRERLYRNAIDGAIAAANVSWIPPPVGKRYADLRLTIKAGAATGGEDQAPPEPMPGTEGGD